jgi:hypothetical protein
MIYIASLKVFSIRFFVLPTRPIKNTNYLGVWGKTGKGREDFEVVGLKLPHVLLQQMQYLVQETTVIVPVEKERETNRK